MGEIAGSALTPDTVYTERRNGTYAYYDGAYNNLVPLLSSPRGTVVISGNSRAKTLTFYTNSGYVARRYEMEDTGEYGPWEYIVFPLLLGVEYRTTERYLGKPVYVKLVDFGVLPNATTKTVGHGVTGIEYCFIVGGSIASNGKNLIGLEGLSALYRNGGNLVAATTVNMSDLIAHVLMKYTKAAN